MPPVFLLASKDDDVVNYKNSVVLSKALEKQNNTFKFLLFETGGHGYGLKETHFTKTSKWTLKLQRWLSSLGFL
jgi:predicted esterase